MVDAVMVEDRGVALDVARPGVQAPPRVAVLDDQSPGADHQGLPRLRLDLRPRLVGGAGERGVLRLVLGEADDPRVVLGGPAGVPELELLQPQHPRAQLAAPSGGAASRAPRAAAVRNASQGPAAS